MKKTHRNGAGAAIGGSGEEQGLERGYCVATRRTWSRIRREFAGGASVPWLSARYGPAERTIAHHAKAEGWRRKDLAREAEDAETEGEAEADAEAWAEIDDDWDHGPSPTQDERAGSLETVDLEAARSLALGRARKAMDSNDPRQAQDWLKLAHMLEDTAARNAGAEGTGVGRSPEDEAALRVILERLGIED